MTIEKMQAEIRKAGWQWVEHMFNDQHTHIPCMLEFTKDTSTQALSTYPRPADCVGWGRFDRYQAWQMAYDYIIKGQKTDLPCN